MHGQVGSWDEYLAIALDGDALSWLDSFGPDRRVLVSVSGPERTVEVRPVEVGGLHVTHRGVRNTLWHGVKVPWTSVSGPHLERFELLDVVFRADGDRAVTVLPPLHQLPWPRLRDCAGYCAVDVAMAELMGRLQSAVAAYGGQPLRKWLWTPPPQWLLDALPPGAYSAALRRALGRA